MRPSPRGEMRMLVGYVLMPPTSALLAAASFWDVTPGVTMPESQPGVAMALVGAIVGFVVTIFAAVPAVAWLLRRGPLSLGRLLLLGAALGNAPFAIILVGIFAVQLARGTLSWDVGHLWYGWHGAFRNMIVALVCGAGSAAVFWFVAVRGTELEAQDPPFALRAPHDRADAG
jgi:hypothetical protein